MGHFLFGGSDFVMVFQAGYEFTLDSPRKDPHQGYSRLLTGERLGRLRSVSAASTQPAASCGSFANQVRAPIAVPEQQRRLDAILSRLEARKT